MDSTQHVDRVEIVGAGISGLTLGLALHRSGLAFHIHEAAERFAPVGAGIILAVNAMAVFRALGVHDALVAAGAPCRALVVRDGAGRAIRRMETARYAREIGVTPISIHRADLARILAAEIGDQVTFGARLDCLEGDALVFEGGARVASSCIVGADGARSRLRRALFGERNLRQARQICWRGVAEMVLPQQYSGEVTEVWTPAGRLGFTQINARQVYWFAVATRGRVPADIEQDALAAAFAGHAPHARAMIMGTEPAAIHRADLADLPTLPSWHSGRACLVGDAAHAMTPNLGQGGCQAVEDAWVLARCLAELPLARAFTEYQRLRKPKATEVARRSWQLGQISHLRAGPLVRARNGLMRMAPERADDAFMRRVYAVAGLG